ncbi:MAG: hypothetical protein KBC56_04820 [Flavobacterium sp.]|nr:hypothetical protein [Flavobacterium sp.]
MEKHRRIFNEETVKVTFRVPISRKVDFQKDANILLDKYDVRIPSFVETLVKSEEKTPSVSFGSQKEKYFENIASGKKEKNMYGGEVVPASMDSIFLVDGFKNLFREKNFEDDYYVRENGKMIHYTNVVMAQKYMNENDIK